MHLWSGLLVCLVGLGGLAPAHALTAVADGCGPLNDPQQLAHTARIILVGEIHGTREFPALVARLACQALDRGRPVTLAVELPHEEEARLAAYVASDGGAQASAALTAGSHFWHKVRDGRSSGAMVVLIEQARRWREQGKPVRVIAIDKTRGAAGTRDEHMAARVREAALGTPGGLVIALTGNMHNRLTPLEATHLPMRIDTPMGMLLRDLAPVSLGSERMRGSFFACMPECKVHGLEDGGTPLAAPRIIPARNAGRGPYTHLVELGSTTASPPAIDAAG
jgi:hypothetical protein